jgi:hypothetical protein
MELFINGDLRVDAEKSIVPQILFHLLSRSVHEK